MNRFEIRLASVSDASAIAELIYSTSLACCFTPEQPCPEWFKESVTPTQIASHLESEKMVWVVAEEDQSLVGVLSVSDSIPTSDWSSSATTQTIFSDSRWLAI